MTINRTNLTWSENNRVNRLLRRARRDTRAWSEISSIVFESALRSITSKFDPILMGKVSTTFRGLNISTAAMRGRPGQPILGIRF